MHKIIDFLLNNWKINKEKSNFIRLSISIEPNCAQIVKEILVMEMLTTRLLKTQLIELKMEKDFTFHVKV